MTDVPNAQAYAEAEAKPRIPCSYEHDGETRWVTYYPAINSGDENVEWVSMAPANIRAYFYDRREEDGVGTRLYKEAV